MAHKSKFLCHLTNVFYKKKWIGSRKRSSISLFVKIENLPRPECVQEYQKNQVIIVYHTVHGKKKLSENLIIQIQIFNVLRIKAYKTKIRQK